MARSRGLRGGEWFEGASLLASSQRVSGYFPDNDSDYFGFRVAAADPGDANGDGQVDVNDLTIVLSQFSQTGVHLVAGQYGRRSDRQGGHQ